MEVATLEPCLNCTCSKGALLCYLRVCPGLPNPPPPGCILLHRYKTCCPELICTGNTTFLHIYYYKHKYPFVDFPVATNEIEGRSEPENGLDFGIDNAGPRNGNVNISK